MGSEAPHLEAMLEAASSRENAATLNAVVVSGMAMDSLARIRDLEARLAEVERDRGEAQTILAMTADRLNNALREAGCGEIVGSPYHSFAIRDGVVSLYDKGAALRSALAAMQEERDEARAKSAIDERQCDEMTEAAGRLAVQLAAAEERERGLREALEVFVDGQWDELGDDEEGRSYLEVPSEAFGAARAALAAGQQEGRAAGDAESGGDPRA